jgi:hypothetical protein
MPYLNPIQINDPKKVICLALLFVFTTRFCLAQRADSLCSGLRISSVGFSLGTAITQTGPTESTLWLKEFNSMAPTNPNLNANMDTSGHKLNLRQVGFSINFFLNLKSNKAKSNFAKRSEHRFGIHYTANPNFQLGFFKADSISADTFFSNTTGYFNVDSTTTGHGYFYSLKGKSVGIDFSEIIYPFKSNILRPYTGMSVGAGILFSSLLVAYNAQGEAFWKYRHNVGYSVEESAKKETTRLKPSFSGYAAVPFGVSLNKKTKPTLISLFVETRVGVKYEKYTSRAFMFYPICYIQAGLKLLRN